LDIQNELNVSQLANFFNWLITSFVWNSKELDFMVFILNSSHLHLLYSMKSKKTLLILSLLAITTITYGQRKELPTFITDSLENYINEGIKAWNIPGLAIAIVQKDKVIYMKGYGVTSIKNKQFVNENTLFQIGSITKSFTATAAAMLHVEKKLSLKDQVSEWLPYYKLKDSIISEQVNIIDLLSHRTGFDSYKGDLVTYFSGFSREEVVKRMALLDVNQDFRDSYGYSNSAYTAVGEILEKVEKKPWGKIIEDKILAPLEMFNTKMVYSKKENYSNIAFPHTIINNKVEKLEYSPMDNIQPAGSMLSSVNDLSHWLIAQINKGKYNNTAALPYRAMRITRRPFSTQGFNQTDNARTHFYNYGLGFFVRDINGFLSFQHSGGLTGFSANHIIIPEKELGIVILTNDDVNNFFLDLTNVVVDAFLELPFKNYSSNSIKSYHEELLYESKEKDSLRALAKINGKTTSLNKFIGTYKNDAYGKISIIEESNQLKLLLSNQKDIRGVLEYIGENKFLCNFSHYEYGTVVVPFTMKNESVISFDLLIENIEGNIYKFTKCE